MRRSFIFFDFGRTEGQTAAIWRTDSSANVFLATPCVCACASIFCTAYTLTRRKTSLLVVSVTVAEFTFVVSISHWLLTFCSCFASFFFAFGQKKNQDKLFRMQCAGAQEMRRDTHEYNNNCVVPFGGRQWNDCCRTFTCLPSSMPMHSMPAIASDSQWLILI